MLVLLLSSKHYFRGGLTAYKVDGKTQLDANLPGVYAEIARLLNLCE